MSQGLYCLALMAVYGYTDAGMNVMPTAAYCNGIGLGVGAQLWCGAVLPTDIEPRSSLLMAI